MMVKHRTEVSDMKEAIQLCCKQCYDGNVELAVEDGVVGYVFNECEGSNCWFRQWSPYNNNA